MSKGYIGRKVCGGEGNPTRANHIFHAGEIKRKSSIRLHTFVSVRRGGGRSAPSLLDDETSNSPVVAVQLLTPSPPRFLPTFLPRMTAETTNEQSAVDNWKELTTRRHDMSRNRSKESDGDDDGDGGVVVGLIMVNVS